MEESDGGNEPGNNGTEGGGETSRTAQKPKEGNMDDDVSPGTTSDILNIQEETCSEEEDGTDEKTLRARLNSLRESEPDNSGNSGCPEGGCKKCHQEFKKIWAYMFSMEMISSERIQDLEAQLTKCKAYLPQDRSNIRGAYEAQNKEKKTDESKDTTSVEKPKRGNDANSEKESKNDSRIIHEKRASENKSRPNPTVSGKSPASERIQEYSNENGASTSGQSSGRRLFPMQKKTTENQHTGDTPPVENNAQKQNLIQI